METSLEVEIGESSTSNTQKPTSLAYAVAEKKKGGGRLSHRGSKMRIDIQGLS